MFNPEAVQSVTKEDIIDAINNALFFNERGQPVHVEDVLIELLEKFDDA